MVDVVIDAVPGVGREKVGGSELNLLTYNINVIFKRSTNPTNQHTPRVILNNHSANALPVR